MVYVSDNSFSLGLETHLYGWAPPPPPTAVIKPSNGKPSERLAELLVTTARIRLKRSLDIRMWV